MESDKTKKKDNSIMSFKMNNILPFFSARPYILREEYGSTNVDQNEGKEVY